MVKVFNKIEIVDIEKLKAYENNPKIHNDYQIDKLVKSIESFGFTVPIIINGEGVVITGHGRLEAARKIGMEKLPCIKREDLTDTQVRAFRILDNKVSESSWDIDFLAKELEDLTLEDIEIELTGFDDKEVLRLLEVAEVKRESEVEVKEDIRECPICGFKWDIYQAVMIGGIDD